MKTTTEIIKPCIEYKQITFTEHWCKTKNQKWVSVESEIEFLSDLLYDGLYNDNYRTYVKIEGRIKKLKGSDDE